MTYKNKLLSFSSHERKSLKDVIPSSLIKLRDLYFFDEGTSHALLNLVADKYLRIIVNMIYNMLACYLLIEIPPITASLIYKYKREASAQSKSPNK